MQVDFFAISEPSQPGPKWQKLFNTFWPAYKAWMYSKGAAHTPGLKTSQAALRYYMPEMVPTYERLCLIADADDVAARFLTGFQPPAYISACSQAGITEGTVQLVRNYDYHPDLFEGGMLMSAWNGKKVIAITDSISGVLDGMNEDGLAISLAFGGRKEVGEGFGIPFILRYVLEFCNNVPEAVDTLTRVPSHMSYNVTVVDRSGAVKTVQLSPDRAPFVSDAVYATNHQRTVDWPENAEFNKTVERAAFLESALLYDGLDTNKLAETFLKPPLYNTRFKEGLGTLYTAIYRPLEGTVELRWPGQKLLQNFDDFQEQSKLIKYQQSSEDNAPGQGATLPDQGTKKQLASSMDRNGVAKEFLINGMAQSAASKENGRVKTLHKNLLSGGRISWEKFAEFWSNLGKEYWGKWRK